MPALRQLLPVARGRQYHRSGGHDHRRLHRHAGGGLHPRLHPPERQPHRPEHHRQTQWRMPFPGRRKHLPHPVRETPPMLGFSKCLEFPRLAGEMRGDGSWSSPLKRLTAEGQRGRCRREGGFRVCHSLALLAPLPLCGKTNTPIANLPRNVFASPGPSCMTC